VNVPTLRTAALRHLDTPTVLRRALAVPDYVGKRSWDAILISFVARVASGEIFWR
jgi:hypothetical protein